MFGTFAQNFTKALQNAPNGPIRLSEIDGHTAPFLVAELLKEEPKNLWVLVAKNQQELTEFNTLLETLAPTVQILTFPAWDVQPYDRHGPNLSLQAARMQTLSILQKGGVQNAVVLTTPAALATKVPPKTAFYGSGMRLHPGDTLQREKLVESLLSFGYHRVETVYEPGEFALRGALIDFYPGGEEHPLRLDFFDDEIENIYTFEPQTQKRLEELKKPFYLTPAAEISLNDEGISRFRTTYLDLFPKGREDTLYKDISEGVPNAQMAHYMPLFYKDGLASFFDFLPENTFILTQPSFRQGYNNFIENVKDAYNTRLNLLAHAQEEGTYRPLKPESLYIGEAWLQTLQKRKILHITPEETFGTESFTATFSLNIKGHLPFSSQKTVGETIGHHLIKACKKELKQQKCIVLSFLSLSGAQRVQRLLKEEGLGEVKIGTWHPEKFKKGTLHLIVSPITWGFSGPNEGPSNLWLVSEQDIYGEKQNTSQRKKVKRKPEEIIHHFSELQPGDYVVHNDHGVGKFIDLVTLKTDNTEQDFIMLHYDGGDKLYVPVVGLDVLSRYSAGDVAAPKTDKLGGAAWQARKAKIKKRLLDLAQGLIKTVAKRKKNTRPPYQEPQGLYDEFAAKFPYVPTPEQQQAIDDIKEDLLTPTPMDRLVVGDVGFGKTEVALRAAFIAALDGRQVAIIAPTTLLARQHFKTFKERFSGFDVRVASLSRLTPTAEAKRVRQSLKEGNIEIVVGTHALLSKHISFANLGLIIVDEEQRFGVTHKERLKELKSTVDVLTLTATPIPRTLHMSLSGLRELSVISTPPVDRLAVHTFLLGYDSKTLKDAIEREIYRDGQVYVVTPRVEGLEKLATALRELVPEAKIRTAHGQMDKNDLENVMADFYDGKFHVLIATTIIESGLDVPRANTMIIHRADRFGLAQLYQLRGRVGRSKTRAYAYLLLPPGGRVTEDAHKRLQILKKLDYIGASFHLANYDMDMRGPGNILGAEQSGHIREVGFELYNQMLHEAIQTLEREGNVQKDAQFTPNLQLGLTYRIPEEYAPDLGTRMRLYRNLSALKTMEEIDTFEDSLLDRFGMMPKDVRVLVDVVRLQNICRALNIEKIEAGEKGLLISFYEKKFAAPEELLKYIMARPGVFALRPDQKVTWHRRWAEPYSRLESLKQLLEEWSKFIEVQPIDNRINSQNTHGKKEKAS